MQREDWMSDEGYRSGVEAEKKGSPGLDWGSRQPSPLPRIDHVLVGLGAVALLAAILYCVGAYLGPLASQHSPILLLEFDASNRFDVMATGLWIAFVVVALLGFACMACYVAYVVLGVIGRVAAGVLRDVVLRVVHFANVSK